MTIYWNPTIGHTYKVYEIVKGKRIYAGQSKAGSYTNDNLKPGPHSFVVTATNAGGESMPSNELTFKVK